MKPLYEFLIPRLYLLQGGGWLQLHRLQCNDLRMRQLAFRRTRLWPFRYVRKHPERVDPRSAVMPVAHIGRALAELPGGAVAGERIDSEFLDFAFAHAGEEIPMLVMLARMRLAEPPVLVKIILRLWNSVLAFAGASGPVAFARSRLRRRHVRLDADVAFEARSGSGFFHPLIMGS